jgi:hypothetical protein
VIHEENSMISNQQSKFIFQDKPNPMEEKKSQESFKEGTEESESSEDDNYLEELLERRKIDSLRKSFANVDEIPNKFSQNDISYIPGMQEGGLNTKRSMIFLNSLSPWTIS